jgi:hypothetical protein
MPLPFLQAVLINEHHKYRNVEIIAQHKSTALEYQLAGRDQNLRGDRG